MSRFISTLQNSSLDAQGMHFAKAMSTQKAAVKQKHVRALIMAAHTDGNCHVFWLLADKAQLTSHPLVCWKFCHVLYRLLRDGPRHTLSDSWPHCFMLNNLLDYWTGVCDGYGPVIVAFLKLLLKKLSLHHKYARLTPSLVMTDDQLESVASNEINEFFELAVDLIDMLEAIVKTQAAVFSELHKLHVSSMTHAGQCLLSPLIPCIEESLLIYNHTVKILFKLHSSLPPDLLSGHRLRFNKLFSELKAFYSKSSNLQYYKILIQIPQLPKSPPNFFRACQTSDRVAAAVLLVDPDDDASSTCASRDWDESGNTDLPDSCHDSSAASQQQQQQEQLLLQLQQEQQQEQLQQQQQLQQQLQLQQQQEQLGATRMELGTARQELASCRLQLLGCERQLGVSEERCESLQCRLENCQLSETALQAAAVTASDKFDKLKTVYQQLRQEHVELLRSRAAAENVKQKESEDQQQQLQSELERCRAQMESSRGELSMLRAQADASLLEREDLSSQVQLLRRDKDTQLEMLSRRLQQTSQHAREDLTCALKDMFMWCRQELDNPAFSVVTCPPDYVQSLCSLVLEQQQHQHEERFSPLCSESVDLCRALSLPARYSSRVLSPDQTVDGSVAGGGDGDGDGCGTQKPPASATNVSARAMVLLCHQLAQCVLYGEAMVHSNPDAKLTEEVESVCRQLVDACLRWVEQGSAGQGDEQWRPHLQQLLQLTAGVTESVKADSLSSNQLSQLLTEETSTMEDAINAAAQRMQKLFDEARQARDESSDAKPKFSEEIFTACTSLMDAVRQLVRRSRHLQAEIVEQQGGTGVQSSEEFYARNHRWTEGLISAAKAVGGAAYALVGSADELISGGGKFEELIVATHEITASTAQLVVASKVKAARESTNLAQLGVASRVVSDATGSLVATVRAQIQQAEENSEMELASFSLHKIRRLQMDCRVRVLQLQSELERERGRLAAIHRMQYQMAVQEESSHSSET